MPPSDADLRLLEVLQAQVLRLGQAIGADPERGPTWGRRQDGRPFVEAQDGELRFAHFERGNVFEICTTRDPDELLYQVMAGIVSAMSIEWELAHRVEAQDVRVVIFERRMELLERLSPAWLARWRAEEAQLLRDVGLA